METLIVVCLLACLLVRLITQQLAEIEMVLKYEELINLCCDLIKTFDPVVLTVDSHAEQFLTKHKRVLEDTEAVFLKQVFYGTFRYEEFLK